MELVIEILKLVLPTIIALVSLAYAIKQRSVVKREISRKRYLEDALSSLNQVLASLKTIHQSLRKDVDEREGEEWMDADTIVTDILRVSFDSKRKKLTLRVSYIVQDLGERGGKYVPSDVREYRNLDRYEPQWLIDLFRTNRVITIESNTRIVDFKRQMGNELNFFTFERALRKLIDIEKILLSFEEVYDTVSPNSVNKVNRLIEELIEEIFRVIVKPKRIEIDLDSFSEAFGITKYIMDKVLKYSHIAQRFRELSELISELTEARKELFLKIS